MGLSLRYLEKLTKNTDRRSQQHQNLSVTDVIDESAINRAAHFGADEFSDQAIGIRVDDNILDPCINSSETLVKYFHNNVLKITVIKQHDIE